MRAPLPHHQEQEGRGEEGPAQGGRHVRLHGLAARQEAGDAPRLLLGLPGLQLPGPGPGQLPPGAAASHGSGPDRWGPGN